MTETLRLALINQKGGVGKSSTCFHIAGAFALRGCNVLSIDCDPQASITASWLGVKTTLGLPPERTIARLFDLSGPEPRPEELIHSTQFPNIRCVPSHPVLRNYNHPQPSQAGQLQHELRLFVEAVASEFDVIIFDNPPTLSLCSWTALLASEYVIVPLQPEDYGSQGLAHVSYFHQEAAKINPRLKMGGYLLTMFQRLGVHRAYEQELRKLYGDLVFMTKIRSLKDFKEAISARMPVPMFRPQSQAAQDVSDCVDEIISRTNFQMPKHTSRRNQA